MTVLLGRDAYLASVAVALNASDLTLDHIFQEKYPPLLILACYAAALTTFIRRAAYPVGETSKNGANVPDVSSLTDRLWWDK